MKTRTRWLALALLITLLGGCEMARDALSGARKPSARVVSMQVENLRLDGLDIALGVEVSNPYETGLPIVGMRFALASRGASFFEGSLAEGGTIPGRGLRVLPIRARITFAELLKVLPEIKPGAVIPYDVDATVSVEAPIVGRISLPVGRRGKLPIPTIPDVSLAKVKFTKLRPTEVKGVLALDIENGNGFALDVADLDLGLTLAGQRILDTRAPKVTRLESGAKTRLEIPISFSPLAAGMATYSMLTGSGASYGLTGRLSVKTPFGSLSMPIDVTGDTVFTR
jgi:LEA14-like dessication related protein